VPDLRGFSGANGLVGKTDHEIREVLGNKFPKRIYHSIACIGALVAHRESDHWQVDAPGAPHVGERTEKELISAFVDKIAELSPQLVDLPVLRYRAMINEVSAPGLSSRPYYVAARTTPATPAVPPTIRPLPATSLTKVVGSTLTCRQLPWTTASFPSAMASR